MVHAAVKSNDCVNPSSVSTKCASTHYRYWHVMVNLPWSSIIIITCTVRGAIRTRDVHPCESIGQVHVWRFKFSSFFSCGRSLVEYKKGRCCLSDRAPCMQLAHLPSKNVTSPSLLVTFCQTTWIRSGDTFWTRQFCGFLDTSRRPSACDVLAYCLRRLGHVYCTVCRYVAATFLCRTVCKAYT